MACFLVSAAEAVVVTAVKTIEKKHEEKVIESGGEVVEKTKIPFSRKLSWLIYMLVGGAILLAFEHVWHGEVTPWFPFLTAMSDAEETSQMLHEMATVGVSMAALITVVWAGMCVVADRIVKRSDEKKTSENEA
ncbi:MAG: hypothetical protein VZQ83_05750 [Eubacterium sp.]|nr:hypothetical protein [Eubacterium sp.]